MTHTTELERPAWGVWVDYKIAPPGSYACLVSRFMDNRWTDPEPQWMPAQLRPQLYGEVKVMPYLMPNDPLAAVNALPELLDELERLRGAGTDALEYGLSLMRLLEKEGGDIVPYLMDTDDNSGQRFRFALVRLAAALKGNSDD